MITRQAIIEWQENAPWIDMRQVEQDLIISRALTAIYSTEHDVSLSVQLPYKARFFSVFTVVS